MNNQEPEVLSKHEIKILVRGELDKRLNFITQKTGDTPVDSLSLTPRKYVNMYGSIAGRPQTSVIGQQYFSTTDGYPIFRNSNNAWVSATGSVVG